jgi:glycosyltransferase involved in cell wall biosynthesis
MSIAVLQVIPNLGAGGAEQSCIDIVSGLKSRGDRAIVVTAGGHRLHEVDALGGERYERNVASKNPAIILGNAFWLAKFIREQRVDIIHARSRAPAWSAWLASRMTGCPFVTTFHAAYQFSNPAKQAYNSVMAKADHIIAVSQDLAEHIKDNYRIDENRLTVIYRGIDVDRFNPAAIDPAKQQAMRQHWQVAATDKIILMPARLSPIKGHGLLLDALSRITAALDGVKLIILGDDQGRSGYRRELDTHIATKGLQDKVRIIAHCTDMPTAYSLASLVVAPSLVPEGFGRVPVEAMAMGLPVIASNLGAMKETVLQGETGWLLPIDDPDPWSKQILLALDLTADQRRSMADKGMRRSRTLFNHKHMIAETLAVYDAVLVQKRDLGFGI